MTRREETKRVMVGTVSIGGDTTITVQSMSKLPTTDIAGVLNEIESVLLAGGDIMRVSVPDMDSAKALREIVKSSPLPIVADIHFDYRLALASLDAGVHKLRINPGNIGKAEYVGLIAREAKTRGIPIRVGVNAGSLPKDLLKKFGGPTPEAMVEAARREIEILEEADFTDIVVSLKASSPKLAYEANMLFAEEFSYPIHVGITEAGFGYQGIIASSVGSAMIFSAGIGNTFRVSLTEDPATEVRVAREILRFLGLRDYWVRIISCPMCARAETKIDDIARKIWDQTKNIRKPISIAVMGCVVNGPGEASHADIGVACGKGYSLIFSRGKPIKKVPNDRIVEELMEQVEKFFGKLESNS